MILPVTVVFGASAAVLAQTAAARDVAGVPNRLVVAAAYQMRSDSPAQQCFFTFPDCTSADPAVDFVMETRYDSTGCTFRQDVAWGDKTRNTVLTYNGGHLNTVLATFAHTYATPRVYQISYTIDVPVNPHKKCGGGTAGLQFTLLAPPLLACQSSPVTVPGTAVQVPIAANDVTINYGSLPLTFTPSTTSRGARCTMRSAAGVLPVDLSIPGVTSQIPLGQTDMTATVDLLAANMVAATIPLCDFSHLQGLTSASSTPPLADFARTNNCLLTPTYRASWDFVARWKVPSVVQMAHNQSGNSNTVIYATQPLTYYVDLDTLPLPQDFSGDTMSALVEFIFSTLAQNLPVLDRVALIQDPSVHLLVTDPFGRVVGVDNKNKVHGFGGTGYAEADGRSIAWILEPVLGDYHVHLRAPSGTTFGVDVADLQFLGHGQKPLIENFTWTGSLGRSGTATKRFSIRGTALAPVLRPHESATRVRRRERVRFTLADSVIPLGIRKAVWHFGDGNRATGRRAAHRYRRAGRFTPTVTVTDAVGYTVTVKLPVIVVKR